MAALRQLPIVYLVQDNEWDISANAKRLERKMLPAHYAKGFKGIEVRTIDGSNLQNLFKTPKTFFQL